MSRNHRSGRRNALQNNAPASASRGRNEVRIIGGRWRGRKIRFPAGLPVRPSPDRVRETLFNWLAPTIAGARCLDLFAGTGVLGFEALSRGAASAVLVDRDPGVVAHLNATSELLGADTARVIRADAEDWLAAGAGPFDLVFVDPPFAAGRIAAVLARLAAPGRLAAGARVYLEAAAADGLPPLPAGWRAHRSGRAGDVGYHLVLGPQTEEQPQ